MKPQKTWTQWNDPYLKHKTKLSFIYLSKYGTNELLLTKCDKLWVEDNLIMQGRSYLSFDPMIMETLNLNERRIHHIFDILHGRDTPPYTQRKSQNNKSALARLIDQ